MSDDYSKETVKPPPNDSPEAKLNRAYWIAEHWTLEFIIYDNLVIDLSTNTDREATVEEIELFNILDDITPEQISDEEIIEIR